MDGLFIQNLADPNGRTYYFSWVLCLLVSIVLHELGHGWAALRLGDPTPRVQGRMTGNPLIHMGPLSLGCLFLTGMAWGAMPVDTTRLKGKFGDAKVCLAGPAMNMGLAGVGILAAAVWLRAAGDLPDEGTIAKRGFDLLWMFCYLNVLLVIFNLLPVPPLDGSRILANMNRRYASWINSDSFQAMGFLPFIAAFLLIWVLIDPIQAGTLEVISLLGGVEMELVEQYWL